LIFEADISILLTSPKPFITHTTMPKLIQHRTRIEDLGLPRVVIIGGGFAGLQLAQSLRKSKFQVVLFDKHNHHTFQPLLYQVATSGLETGAIIYPFRKSFAKQKNFYFRYGEVMEVIPEQNLIQTSIGDVRYDYLVIATGATTNYYGMEDIARNSFPMKTIEDSIKLRNHIIANFEEALLTEDEEYMNSLMDYVIVGGGPTGVELAGALAELREHVFPKDYKELDLVQMDIHLIEASPRLLNGMSEVSGEKALKFLQDMGVDVRLGQSVKGYDGYTVQLGDGSSIISQTLIWAAGVSCKRLPGIAEEAYQRGNRLEVDAFNKVKTYDNIYALGDAALVISNDSPQGHPQVAPPAIQQAKNLAHNLQALQRKKPLKPFKYKDLGSMATIGRNRAVVDLKSFKTQGVLAWFIWMFVHLMSLVGFRNRVLVFVSWAWSYLSYDKSNRLIIGLQPRRRDKSPVEEG
jgi:NADH dehydrogenase